MSKYKLADTLNIEVDDADKMIKDYFKVTIKLNNYLKYCRECGVKNGYITCPGPYKILRYFPEWKANLDKYSDSKIIGSIERASMNTGIQGSGAQMTKAAMYQIRKYIKENSLQNKVYVVMQVHDALTCEVATSYAEEWSLIQKQIMENCGRDIINRVPVKSDIIISEAWTK